MSGSRVSVSRHVEATSGDIARLTREEQSGMGLQDDTEGKEDFIPLHILNAKKDR